MIIPSYHPPYDVYSRTFAAVGSNFSFFSLLESTYNYNYKDCIAGKYILHVYKRKLGVITETNEEIRIYPDENKTIVVDW